MVILFHGWHVPPEEGILAPSLTVLRVIVLPVVGSIGVVVGVERSPIGHSHVEEAVLLMQSSTLLQVRQP